MIFDEHSTSHDLTKCKNPVLLLESRSNYLCKQLMRFTLLTIHLNYSWNSSYVVKQIRDLRKTHFLVLKVLKSDVLWQIYNF